MFFKKGVIYNLVKFTGKRLCQSFFLNKVKIDSDTSILNSEFCSKTVKELNVLATGEKSYYHVAKNLDSIESNSKLRSM